MPWLCVEADGIKWSRGVYDLIGLDPSDFTPSMPLFLSFVHPDDRIHVRSTLEFARTGAVEPIVFRIMRRDGAIRLLSFVNLEPVPGTDARPICLLDCIDLLEGDTPAASPQMPGPLLADRTRMLVMVLDGRTLVLSPAARAMLGFPPDEQVQLATFLRHVHDEDREVASASMALSVGASSPPVRIRFRRPDAEDPTYLDLGPFRPLMAGNRQIGRWGALRDVTVDVERQRALAACERDFELLMESVPGGAAIVAPDGTVSHINRMAESILGIRRGLRFDEAHPELARDALAASLQSVQAGGRITEDERYVPAIDRWLSYKIVPFGRNVLVTLQPRDDLYRLKSAFQDMTSRCNKAFTLGQVGLWEYDAARRTVWLAQAARDFLGITSMSLDDFMERVHPEDRGQVDEARERAIARREPFQVDFRFTNAYGRECRLRSRGSFTTALRDLSQGLAGVLIDLDGFQDGEPERARAASLPRVEASTDLAVTGAQVRAARGALRWSVRELAEASLVSVATINRYEADAPAVATRSVSVEALAASLRHHGIDFHTGPRGYPAIEIGPAPQAAPLPARASS